MSVVNNDNKDHLLNYEGVEQLLVKINDRFVKTDRFAESDKLGMIKAEVSTLSKDAVEAPSDSGVNYPIQITTEGNAFVNVPESTGGSDIPEHNHDDKYLKLNGSNSMSGDIKTSDSGNIGSSDKYWNNVYANTVWIGGTYKNTTGKLSSDTNYNMYFEQNGVIPFVVNCSNTDAPFIRSGSSIGHKVDLGQYNVPWKTVYSDKFIKYDSSDNYVLLGGGGTKKLTDIAVSKLSYAGTQTNALERDLTLFPAANTLFTGAWNASWVNGGVTNYATNWGTTLDISYNTWYQRLAFNTNGKIEFFKGTNSNNEDNTKATLTKVGDLAFTSDIPTKLSQLEADIPTGTQSDWNETDTESLSYIQNKPGLVSSTADGLVPLADAAVATITSQTNDWVLTKKGDVIDWHKLPSNAFNNTNTYQSASIFNCDTNEDEQIKLLSGIYTIGSWYGLGSVIYVNFTNGNTSSSIQLNDGSARSLNVYYKGQAVANTNPFSIPAGAVVCFVVTVGATRENPGTAEAVGLYDENDTNVNINVTTGNSYYPMTFVTTTGAGNKGLYIDGSTGTTSTSDGIRYNPNAKTCYCSGGFYEASDERLKNFGDDIEVDLDKLAKLSKKYFTWKNDESNTQQIGVSAQEVQTIYPELVDVIDEEGHLSVSYDKLSVVALKGIDVLNDKVKSLEERLYKLEQLIENKLK